MQCPACGEYFSEDDTYINCNGEDEVCVDIQSRGVYVHCPKCSCGQGIDIGNQLQLVLSLWYGKTNHDGDGLVEAVRRYIINKSSSDLANGEIVIDSIGEDKV